MNTNDSLLGLIKKAASTNPKPCATCMAIGDMIMQAGLHSPSVDETLTLLARVGAAIPNSPLRDEIVAMLKRVPAQ